MTPDVDLDGAGKGDGQTFACAVVAAMIAVLLCNVQPPVWFYQFLRSGSGSGVDDRLSARPHRAPIPADCQMWGRNQSKNVDEMRSAFVDDGKCRPNLYLAKGSIGN